MVEIEENLIELLHYVKDVLTKYACYITLGL